MGSSFRAGLGSSLRCPVEPPGTGAATPGNAEKRLSTLNKVKSLGGYDECLLQSQWRWR